MAARTNPTDSPVYQVTMLILCVIALGALAVEAAVPADPEVVSVLGYADYALCSVFFIDFLISLWLAPKRWKYFVRWGWLDLLSSVPALDLARVGRVARILRIFRVLRAMRAARVLTTLVLRHRAGNTFIAASMVALLLIVFSSIAILHVERDAESNIKSAEDAIWWAFVTITTVGYGDRYPVTAEGRFVAAILMCAGVGLFGTFSAFLAAWLISPEESARNDELAELRKEIQAVRQLLEERGVAEAGRTSHESRG
jgi:voltage-gated potassium channel